MDGQLDYNQMVQRALRSVMAEALSVVAEHGLSDGHHFYITFLTDQPGVEMPDWLRAEHPEKITIVLQHEFYDLAVTNDRFSVRLSFDGRPAELVAPFRAVRQFADPSVNFGLALQPESSPEDDEETEAEAEADFEEAQNAAAGEVVDLDAFRKR